MKKTVFAWLVANGISLVLSLFKENRFLVFTDSLGFMSIFAILISGFIFLDQFGYFDVFGYSFRKTYLVFMKKYAELDEDDKVRYQDLFAYKSYRDEKRAKPSFSFYIFTALLWVESILMAFIYTQA